MESMRAWRRNPRTLEPSNPRTLEPSPQSESTHGLHSLKCRLNTEYSGETLRRLLETARARGRSSSEDTATGEVLEQFRVAFEPLARLVASFSRHQSAQPIEDRVQDVWLAWWKALPDYQPALDHPNFAGWLVQVGSRALSRSNAKALRWRSVSGIQECDLEPAGTLHELPPRGIEGAEMAVWEMITERLSAQESQLIRWRYQEGKPIAWIAESLGITPKAVRDRFHRVHRKLRKTWEP